MKQVVYRRPKALLAATGWMIGVMATLLPGWSGAADDVMLDKLLEMPLESLLQVTVRSASGLEESLRNAPAAMVVISQQDIRKRGYTDLTEVLADLPGFDTVVSMGTLPTVGYQRGYRTPFGQRSLFLINGKVDNHLWSHAPIISRQFPLTHIERIEVLYGPAGAVYGPNAFLGVINVITHDPADSLSSQTEISAQTGSFDTQAVELSTRGKWGELGYSVAVRSFDSDEPGLDDYPDWGYATEDRLSNPTIWGPVLDHEHRNIPYGQYANRSSNYGLFSDFHLRQPNGNQLRWGYYEWQTREGYGLWYVFDQAQPNQSWIHTSTQAFVEHEAEWESNLKATTLLSYRTSRIHGGWAEATVDWNPGMEAFSYVSISSWNSLSDSRLFRQDYEFRLNDLWQLSGGIKLEQKTLTKAYDLCGYWSTAHCSSSDNTDLGPEGQGAGVFHSTAEEYVIQPGPLASMPQDNLIDTTDKGIYIQGIYDRDAWRLSAGIRYDDNSLYGESVNPRLAVIHRFDAQRTAKLVYGRAFQEPSPLHLFGGWQGRASNPDLQPEEAENLELILMWQTRYWLHDMSFYVSRYQNVIREQAENIGGRDIHGVEYRGSYQFDNPWDAAAITGYLYYGYTQATSEFSYDHEQGAWVDRSSSNGDIAPHKINLGLDVPLSAHWSFNVRANYVHDRPVYSRNPLRAEGKKVAAYTTLDAQLRFHWQALELALKVRNLLDEAYYHPGVEDADSGDDFTLRAAGFRNSLIPQVGRHYLARVNWRF